MLIKYKDALFNFKNIARILVVEKGYYSTGPHLLIFFNFSETEEGANWYTLEYKEFAEAKSSFEKIQEFYETGKTICDITPYEENDEYRN